MEKKLQPKLRFSEFNEDWSNKKIKDIFKIFNGYAFSSSDSQNNGVRWVKIADVGIQKMKENSVSYLPVEFKEKYNDFLLKENDYVIALTRPILNHKLKIAKINKAFDNSLLNQRVGKIKSKEHLNFIYNFLQKHEIVSKIESNIAGSDPPNLSPKEINHLKIAIPTMVEQNKISIFLSFVDSKVDKLEEQKGLLEEYKKGTMQKIFSQETRFKDEDGEDYPEWRNGLIKDFGYFYYGKSAPKTSISPDGEIPCVRYGELYSTYNEVIHKIKSYTIMKAKGLKLSNGGELLVPRVGENPLEFSKCSYLPFKGVAIGEMISVYNSKENGVYLSYYFNSRMINEFAKLVEGGNVSNLYFRYLENVKIILPSLEEQEKIVNYLSTIDKKIKVINAEIDEMKEFKNGLLQQMFV